MLRYLSTGSSVIAALMAADEPPAVVVMRPDLLEFLLFRTMVGHEPRDARTSARVSTPDRPGGSTG